MQRPRHAVVPSLIPSPTPPAVATVVYPAGPRIAVPVLQLPPSQTLTLDSACLTTPPDELPVQITTAGFSLDVGDGVAGERATIGEGAYASVKRLRHKQTGELVALKIVEKQALIVRSMLPQMGREVRIQGALQHPHILRLLLSFEDEHYVFMLLEYCGGGTLRSVCAQMDSQRLSELHAARYIFQILHGVDYMHQCSCVHRDLKPDNVLLTLPHRDVRICDFGWSAEVLVERALLTTCGTPNYWAPEQFYGHPQSFPTDIWALGNLIYEVLVGHPPFWGSQEAIRQKVLAVDVRFPPDLLSDNATHIIHCHLQLDPAARAPAAWTHAEHQWLEEQRRREKSPSACDRSPSTGPDEKLKHASELVSEAGVDPCTHDDLILAEQQEQPQTPPCASSVSEGKRKRRQQRKARLRQAKEVCEAQL
eukprot:TRINITY_DN102503_c0_g1_i1.p1 TRINITY_DN102503_c0_g1~~TRINITY_DN102503_c0_g1_i1.p1  ORF type:complete len:422 (-),score=48.03 TRINITY_DN102503_c0_g1_i1:59-1324(-)